MPTAAEVESLCVGLNTSDAELNNAAKLVAFLSDAKAADEVSGKGAAGSGSSARLLLSRPEVSARTDVEADHTVINRRKPSSPRCGA